VSEDVLTHVFMESTGTNLLHHYEETSNLMELRVKACHSPLNIFGIPHGYSIKTSVSQPGFLRTPLRVPQDNKNFELPPKKSQIALKVSRKLLSGN
jgi:hypothetical protein